MKTFNADAHIYKKLRAGSKGTVTRNRTDWKIDRNWMRTNPQDFIHIAYPDGTHLFPMHPPEDLEVTIPAGFGHDTIRNVTRSYLKFVQGVINHKEDRDWHCHYVHRTGNVNKISTVDVVALMLDNASA